MSDRPNSEKIQQSAFENVQARDIIVGSITQTINQGKTPKAKGFPENLPLSGVVKFVGREDELQNLHQMLQENNQLVIAAIARST